MKAYFEGYEDLMTAGLGFEIDTCSHFLRIMFAGVFDAYADLKIILGHLGEGLPFTIQRLNEHTRGAAARRGLRKTPMQYLKDNLLVTTSGNFFTPAFLCALFALGADNILFAVDWPYDALTAGVNFLRNLPISEGDKRKIAHLNAERVLRL
jgi:2,3-dihydroxybenzoate decarboxylase